MSDDTNETTQPNVPVSRPKPARRGGGMGLLIGLTLGGVGLFAAAGGAIWYALNHEDAPEVTDNSYLRVSLSGLLSEEAADGGLFEDPNNLPPTLGETIAAVREAATDDRIDGILLELDGASAGLASWQELRDALVDFRAEDKPCVVHAPSFLENASYMVATACDAIVMAPAAGMIVPGYRMELTYYKGTLDKLGIEPDYEHVGDFKSFIETYERTGPSEPAAEAYSTLIDGLYAPFVDTIAAGRGVDAETVRGWIDRPVMVPDLAVERGMIDATGFADAMLVHAQSYGDDGWADKLAEVVTDEQVDEAKETYTKLSTYVKRQRADKKKDGTAVAVVYASGNIVTGAGGDGGLFGDDGNLYDGEFSDWMSEAREDDGVEAVVVRVDSRGGSGLAAANMWREVARTKASGKPVVVSFGNAAASGGYLMSANADYIVSQPGTLTGSIGVFGGKFALGGLYDKIGMTTHVFERGESSGLLSMTTPFSEGEREVFKEYLSSFYTDFVQKVADGRGMSYEDVHAVAQGRVWTGAQALDHGLVDALGGVDEAVAKAAELAELDDFVVRQVPARKTFFEQLLEDLEEGNLESAAQATVLEAVTPDALQELSVLDAVARTGGVAAFLPGTPTVR